MIDIITRCCHALPRPCRPLLPPAPVISRFIFMLYASLNMPGHWLIVSYSCFTLLLSLLSACSPLSPLCFAFFLRASLSFSLIAQTIKQARNGMRHTHEPTTQISSDSFDYVGIMWLQQTNESSIKCDKGEGGSRGSLALTPPSHSFCLLLAFSLPFRYLFIWIFSYCSQLVF